MNDWALCFIGGLIVFAYAIYQATTPADGIVFGSVLLALGTLAGIKISPVIDRYRKV